MTHTPGPWERYDAEGLAMTYTFVRSLPTGRDTASIFPDDHLEANARLIAAAPDLLEANVAALEACVECEGDVSYDCTRAPCPQIRAAIAKAEGRYGRCNSDA